jgi:hypothetical protein
MHKTRMTVLSTLVLLGLLVGPGSRMAWADSDMTLAGFADVLPVGAGGTLSLPLPAGSSPVTINVTFGIPSVTIPVQISTSTRIKSDVGLPVTLTDGDRIKVKIVAGTGVLRATKLEIEAFPELELVGTVKGLPAAGVTLPLPTGTTVDFTLALGVSAVEVPIRLTAGTKVHHKPLTIKNGDTIRVDAAVRNNAIVATEIGDRRHDDDD